MRMSPATSILISLSDTPGNSAMTKMRSFFVEDVYHWFPDLFHYRPLGRFLMLPKLSITGLPARVLMLKP